jgi:hypothetical protein
LSFTADVYVISGSDKNHPHADILSGILNAVYYQKKEKITKIVLTGSHGLSAEKNTKFTRKHRDYQTFFQRKMRIIHTDDIQIYCEHKPDLVKMNS